MTITAIATTSTYIQGGIDYSVATSSSGITVTVSLYFRRTNVWSGMTDSTSVTQYICISSAPDLYGYSETDGIYVAGGMQNQWQGPVFTATRTFDPSRGGENIYVGWKTVDNVSNRFTGAANAVITLPYAEPSAPTVSATGATTNSISLSWQCSSFGTQTGTGHLYGGTSPAPTTEISTTSSTAVQAFTHTGLSPNTTYYYRGRAQDANGNWGPYSSEIVVATIAPTAKLYGSVNGATKQVHKLYGSVGGVTKTVTKLYGSVNGVTKLIYQA